jgi:DNA-binding NtrC family response regulator
MPSTVLAVHSEADALNMLISAIRTAGYDVVGFSDPLAALNAIEADSHVRVLVTRIDFGPGKLNGVALARMLRHNVPRDIGVVFVGRSENERYLDDGVGEFVPHPVDPTALIDAVGRILLEKGEI